MLTKRTNKISGWGAQCPVSRENRVVPLGDFTAGMRARLEALATQHLSKVKDDIHKEVEKQLKTLGLKLDRINYEILDYYYEGEFSSKDTAQYHYGQLTIKVNVFTEMPTGKVWRFSYQDVGVFWWGREFVWADVNTLISPIIDRIKKDLETQRKGSN